MGTSYPKLLRHYSLLEPELDERWLDWKQEQQPPAAPGAFLHHLSLLPLLLLLQEVAPIELSLAELEPKQESSWKDYSLISGLEGSRRRDRGSRSYRPQRI